ncbi:hypothetical protein [Mycobacteroides abscessus]|uniref:hypothetical protein n=1 Tax=Mycobacteroides abscessus TaxID=36809 RepID=UPI0009C86726|nr:hypothetical protein [Mycobacteroides abscessus]SKN31107.1 Uncharacterised protein [Mycobacteroides abscessus subsp. abscessus]
MNGRAALLCPVCRKPIVSTAAGAVRWHNDKAGGNCPMSGKPYAWARPTDSEAIAS